jgi:hypothetical protein
VIDPQYEVAQASFPVTHVETMISRLRSYNEQVSRRIASYEELTKMVPGTVPAQAEQNAGEEEL